MQMRYSIGENRCGYILKAGTSSGKKAKKTGKKRKEYKGKRGRNVYKAIASWDHELKYTLNHIIFLKNWCYDFTNKLVETVFLLGKH